MAVYKCRECGARGIHPRWYLWYFDGPARCPLCGTEKLRRLAELDRIDPLIWNLYRPFASFPSFAMHLCHCRFCRIQFYDRNRSGGQ